jgi:hypothetical protein
MGFYMGRSGLPLSVVRSESQPMTDKRPVEVFDIVSDMIFHSDTA